MPFRTVAAMATAGVRSRLGRSAVTLFGVVLGTAFLMAAGTADILRSHFANEERDRVVAATAAVNAAAELGTLDGRTLAIWVDEPGRQARWMLERLRTLGDVRLRIVVPAGDFPAEPGERVNDRNESLDSASALIICNEGATQGYALPTRVESLGEQIVMDMAGQYNAEQLAARGLRYRHLLGEASSADLGGFVAAAPIQATTLGGRRTWIIAISLVVSGIGIANALLMSVTERFREIGTLKCLGAPNRLVVQLFMIESALLGLIGSLIGLVLGWSVATGAASTGYGWALVWSNLPWPGVVRFGGVCLVMGIVVAMVAAIYPAIVAARMMPADALRSEV